MVLLFIIIIVILVHGNYSTVLRIDAFCLMGWAVHRVTSINTCSM